MLTPPAGTRICASLAASPALLATSGGGSRHNTTFSLLVSVLPSLRFQVCSASGLTP
jgi:hypothetical protein